MSNTETNEDEFFPTEQEELSFQEILTTVSLNDEVILTIPREEVIRVKTGLKNLKAKQSAKMKEEGLAPDPSTFTFVERPCHQEDLREFYIDLSIQLTRKSTVKVLKLTIPEQEF